MLRKHRSDDLLITESLRPASACQRLVWRFFTNILFAFFCSHCKQKSGYRNNICKRERFRFDLYIRGDQQWLHSKLHFRQTHSKESVNSLELSSLALSDCSYSHALQQVCKFNPTTNILYISESQLFSSSHQCSFG